MNKNAHMSIRLLEEIRLGVIEPLGVLQSEIEKVIYKIANEYKQEHERVECSPEQQRRELLQGLLAGEPADASELGYLFDAWHIGMIATGVHAKEALQILKSDSNRQLLSVSSGKESWAWLGGQQRDAITDIENLLSAERLREVSLAIGEPARGVEGWRLTHRQAQEALQVALLQPQKLTRYADIALLTPWIQETDRAQSLVDMYLSPLDSQKDEGGVLRQTLHAYLGAGYNVKASAARLRVDRSTVRRRVRTIEERLGCPLQTRQAELEVALRLEGLLLGRQIAQVRSQGACMKSRRQSE
jgi:DNA-binding PucR family transcriptional regulator